MRRAFIYTIAFSAILVTTLAIASYFLGNESQRMFQATEVAVVDREAYAIDDIAYDFQRYLNISLSSTQNDSANRTNITVTDFLPCGYSNCTGELTDLETFINGTYANATNIGTTLNASGFASTPRLQFKSTAYTLSYQYNNLSKNSSTFYGTDLVRNYTVNMTLGQAQQTVTDSGWSWSGSPTDLYVALNITDSAGNPVAIKTNSSGYVSPTAQSSAWVNVSGGYLNITAGLTTAGTYSLNITTYNVTASFNATATLADNATVMAWAGAKIVAGNSSTYVILRQD